MNEEIAEDVRSVWDYATTCLEHTDMYQYIMKIPKEKNISYTTHVWRGIKQALYFGYTAICLWIHAFFPFAFPSLEAELRCVTVPSTNAVLKPEKEKNSNEPTAV